MNKVRPIETIDKTNLTDQMKFTLNEISRIKNCFNQQIKERKLNSKKLSKYIAAFDCVDKILFFLLAKSGGVSIISFAAVSANFTLVFSLTTGLINSKTSVTRNKKKNMIKYLFLLKVN